MAARVREGDKESKNRQRKREAQGKLRTDPSTPQAAIGKPDNQS